MSALKRSSESADAVALAATPLVSEHAPDRARPGRRRAQWWLASIGVALLAVLVYETGPLRLASHLTALGWYAPLVFLPYALSTAFDTAGWRVTFAGRRPALGLLYLIRLVGEAVNNVTPTAYLGGEPVKAYVLHRYGVPLAEGTTSVILAKTALTISQMAFVVLGAALYFIARGETRTGVPALVGMVLAGALIATLLVAWQRRGLVESIARLARRIFPRARSVARLERRATEVDTHLRAFYGAHPGAAIASVLFHLGGWVVGAAEVSMIMMLIGHPVGWSEAIMIEALAQPVRLLGIVVPASIGVQEAGGMVIFRMLGMAPDLGLALMLLKRVREIGFSLLGLALLSALRPRSV
jgi:putative membrane protein